MRKHYYYASKGWLFLSTLTLFLFLFSCNCSIQELKWPPKGLTFAFYNVENLFDTINDPAINDKAYLPTSDVAWNTDRYFVKMDNISRVIASMDSLDFPHLLGLSEVENRTVLQDLVANQKIAAADYEIVHFEGPDRRGIDVALLYRQGYFKLINAESLEVDRRGMGRTIPRNILYVKGVVASGDTMHVFVNHWSSRWGGKEASEHLRIGAARFLRTVIDSLFNVNSKSNIVVMGDFNDNPDDASLFSHLKALAPGEDIREGHLYNLAMIPYIQGEGTSFYNNKWDFLDQIIVSANLLKPTESQLVAGSIEIIKKPWMLFYPPRGGEARPNRTSSSTSYYGGYSDHLPVMVRFTKEN